MSVTPTFPCPSFDEVDDPNIPMRKVVVQSLTGSHVHRTAVDLMSSQVFVQCGYLPPAIVNVWDTTDPAYGPVVRQ
jgi:hypothetical protein